MTFEAHDTGGCTALDWAVAQGPLRARREDAPVSDFTLHHVSLYVRHVDASAGFYMKALGLEEIPNRVGRSDIRWFMLDGLRTLHLIGTDPEHERARPMSTHFAVSTTRFDAALRRLDEAGVTWMNLARRPGEVHVRGDGKRQIYFQDVDGHWIEINDASEEP